MPCRFLGFTGLVGNPAGRNHLVAGRVVQIGSHSFETVVAVFQAECHGTGRCLIVESQMQEPILTELTITKVGELQHSPKGHPFVECVERGGLVAFWGSSGNMHNIERIRGIAPPFTTVCGCITPTWPRHILWIPERAPILSLVPARASDADDRAMANANQEPLLSTSDLSRMRHDLVVLVSELERQGSPQQPETGLAGRISRLSHAGMVPREIAALMKTVSEMRNAAEYENKVLSEFESLAVRNAWRAVKEWVKHRAGQA